MWAVLRGLGRMLLMGLASLAYLVLVLRRTAGGELSGKTPPTLEHERENRVPSNSVEHDSEAGMQANTTRSADASSHSPSAAVSSSWGRGTLFAGALSLGLIAAITANLLLRDPRRELEDPRWHMAGTDPEAGRRAMIAYGCGGCHVIPGIRSATGRVGPQLTDIRNQTYIAGRLANLPDNLALWIRDPQSVDPQTAMPNLFVSEPESRHMAAYLYSRP